MPYYSLRKRAALARRAHGGWRPSQAAEGLAIAFILLVIVLYSGAWIWPVDSSTTLEVEQPFITEFKAIAYTVFTVQGCRGLVLALERRSRAASIFLLQATILLLAVTAAGEFFYGAQALIGLFGITFGAIGTFYTIGPRETVTWIYRVIFALLCVSILLAITVPQYGQHQALFHGQWRGLFAHKNQLGQLAYLGVGLTLPFIAARRYKLAILLGAVSLLCLVQSGSATSLASAALAVTLGSVALIANRLNVSHAVLLSWLTAALVIAVVLQSLLLNEALRLLDRDPTFTGRSDIWQSFLELALERPLLGHGPNFLAVDPVLGDWLRESLSVAHLRSAHNGYLETFLEVGLLGLGAMILPYLLIFRRWIWAPFQASPFTMLVLTWIVPIALYNYFESANRLTAGVGTLFVNILLIAALDRTAPKANLPRRLRPAVSPARRQE